ncbi:MAG TPA: YkgJ family cysteine cluster protein [Candidatus Binatia bacterium]|nr:YkgJ family cysteine cluster protein [Candidatus Binatia bacterium]
MSRVDEALVREGLRFECTGCGDCCKARGARSYVYVTLPERRLLAAHLRLGTRAFTAKYCEKTHGFHHLKDPSHDCLFLDGARCTVYAARPQQCRTWPFWPEHLNRRAWTALARECPGVDRGPAHDAAHVAACVAEERRRESLP